MAQLQFERARFVPCLLHLCAGKISGNSFNFHHDNESTALVTEQQSIFWVRTNILRCCDHHGSLFLAYTCFPEDSRWADIHQLIDMAASTLLQFVESRDPLASHLNLAHFIWLPIYSHHLPVLIVRLLVLFLTCTSSVDQDQQYSCPSRSHYMFWLCAVAGIINFIARRFVSIALHSIYIVWPISYILLNIP